jgi:hypothetical protein
LANATGNNIVLAPLNLAIPGVLQHNLWVQNYTSCGAGTGKVSGVAKGSTDCEQWWYTGSWNDFLFEAGGGNTPTATAGTSVLGAPDVVLNFNGSAVASHIDTGMYLTVNASKLPSGTSTADYITLQYSVSSSTATAGDGYVVPYFSNQENAAMPIGTSGATASEFLAGATTPEYNASSLVQQPWLSPVAGATYGVGTTKYSSTPVAIDPANGGTGYLTMPLSALSSSKACLNITQESCSTGTDTTVATQISIGFNARITLNVENVTVTVTGLGITSYPVTPGPTVMYQQTVTRDMIWDNGTGAAGSGDPGNGLGATHNYGENTPETNTLWSANGATAGPAWNLSALSPSWGHTGWINDTTQPGKAVENTYSVAVEQSPSDLGVGNTTITLPSASNTLGKYQVIFNTSYGLPELPQTQGFVSYNIGVLGTVAFHLHDYTTLPGSQYAAVGYASATNGVWTTEEQYATYYATEAQGRYLTLDSAGGGVTNQVATPGSSAPTSSLQPYQLYVAETLTLTETQFCGDFPSASSCAAPPVNNNGTAPLIGQSITVTGEGVMVGLLVVGALVAIAWGLGEKEEKRKMGRRGVGGSLFTSLLSRAEVSFGKPAKSGSLRDNLRGVGKRYISRSKEAYEHDATGTAWLILLGVIVLSAFYGIMAYGILGITVTMVGAAAFVIVFAVGIVVLIVAWEMTKEPAE